MLGSFLHSFHWQRLVYLCYFDEHNQLIGLSFLMVLHTYLELAHCLEYLQSVQELKQLTLAYKKIITNAKMFSPMESLYHLYLYKTHPEIAQIVWV